jgi:hypothetical protein
MSSEEIYSYLLYEFRNRFGWLRLSDEDIPKDVVGLPTVLIDHVINYQFIEKYNKEPELQEEWQRFFDFIEELLNSDDTVIVEVVDTTILEMIASDYDVKLESILPFCGSYTRKSIYSSVEHFYGNPQKAEELQIRYPL